MAASLGRDDSSPAPDRECEALGHRAADMQLCHTGLCHHRADGGVVVGAGLDEGDVLVGPGAVGAEGLSRL
jgi:hypothetical protein